MKILIGLLVVLLAGCQAMQVKHYTAKMQDGSNGYFIKSTYGGKFGSRDMSVGALERSTKGLCPSGHSVMSENEGPHIDEFGRAAYGLSAFMKDITWEIKCNPKS